MLDQKNAELDKTTSIFSNKEIANKITIASREKLNETEVYKPIRREPYQSALIKKLIRGQSSYESDGEDESPKPVAILPTINGKQSILRSHYKKDRSQDDDDASSNSSDRDHISMMMDLIEDKSKPDMDYESPKNRCHEPMVELLGCDDQCDG